MGVKVQHIHGSLFCRTLTPVSLLLRAYPPCAQNQPLPPPLHPPSYATESSSIVRQRLAKLYTVVGVEFSYPLSRALSSGTVIYLSSGTSCSHIYMRTDNIKYHCFNVFWLVEPFWSSLAHVPLYEFLGHCILALRATEPRSRCSW